MSKSKKKLALALRKKSNPKSKKRGANFFSLPQILRQKILYESLPETTTRRLAQIALRIPQADYIERANTGRYAGNGYKKTFDEHFRFFVQRYSKKIAIHWIIFHDLKLVRKMWHARYTRYTRTYEDPWYYHDPGLKFCKTKISWSAEVNLEALETEHGIQNTRSKALEIVGKEKWAKTVSPAEVNRESHWAEMHTDYDVFARSSTFAYMSTMTFLPAYRAPPKLKFHKSKVYRAPVAADANRDFLPIELLIGALESLIPSRHIDRLAKIQFHHKRTANRFIAALCKKFAQVHPAFPKYMHKIQQQWLDDINSCITTYRSKHQALWKEYLRILKAKDKKKEYTEEECEAKHQEVSRNMRPWRVKTSELNLMALEDIYGIPKGRRSAVTARMRAEMQKEPQNFVSTIHGKYRYARGRAQGRRRQASDIDLPWHVGPWIGGAPEMDDDDY